MANNKVYINPETPVTWSDAGADNTLDLGGLAADAVREGDRHDFGASARAEWYEWRIKIDGFGEQPVVGESVDVYWATSDGTNPDGNASTTDAAGAVADLPNFKYLGSAIVQTTTAGDNLVASGVFRHVARYGQPVIHNNSNDVLLSSGDDHWFWVTPIPPEVQ
jgi:hypothetical protein